MIKRDIMNFYHPQHEIYTREYGWVPIDRLYGMNLNRKKVAIAQFDINEIRFIYTTDYEILDSKVRSCLYEFGKVQGSHIHIVVQPDCEILVSIDGGETLEYITARDIHATQKNGYVVDFVNLETLFDMKNKNSKARMTSRNYKTNYTFNSGLTYGIVNDTGSVITRYNGRFSVLGCYKYIEEDDE